MFTTNPARDCVIITVEDGRYIAWKIVSELLSRPTTIQAENGMEIFDSQGHRVLMYASSAERLLRFLGYPAPTDKGLQEVSEQLNTKFSHTLGAYRLEFVYEDKSGGIMSIDLARAVSSYHATALKLRVVRGES